MEELFGCLLILSVLVVIVSAFVWIFGEKEEEVNTAKVCFLIASVISITMILL